jgi:hypothetical protein
MMNKPKKKDETVKDETFEHLPGTKWYLPEGDFEFDEEFINSPWFSASVGIEKVEATKFEMQQHKGIKKAFHSTTAKDVGGYIIEEISNYTENPAGRFGGGFYVASNKQTSFAELASHEKDQFKDPGNLDPQLAPAVDIIEFDVSEK